MVSTCLLVASAVGQCSAAILSAGWSLQIATIVYHLIGGLAGYFIPKALKFSETDSRSVPVSVFGPCHEAELGAQRVREPYDLETPLSTTPSTPSAPSTHSSFFLPLPRGCPYRTMAIETAMKSSAFGFLLAKLHFAPFLARVPPAVSVVWMAVTGSTLAVIWRYIPVGDKKKE